MFISINVCKVFFFFFFWFLEEEEDQQQVSKGNFSF